MPSEDTETPKIADIPGWFAAADQWLFERFLSDGVAPTGDLVEIGAYMGKSAVLIGRHKRPDETFTVCDLFGETPDDPLNAAESKRSYSRLTRDNFESNYLAVHGELPVIVQDMSSTIVDHVRPGTARFVHVDGSHLYEHVAVDADSARAMLMPDGVVAFDDFRNPYTPGVAAAVWEAVLNKDMHPICLSRNKLYATFGDAGPHLAKVEGWLAAQRRYEPRFDVIRGARLIRLVDARPKPPAAQGANRAAASSKPQQTTNKPPQASNKPHQATSKPPQATKARGIVTRAWRRARRLTQR